MIFESVRIKEFRNIQDANIKFSPRLNILVGENGQGKTNILEALSLLSQGESFRYSDNHSLISHNSEHSFLSTQITQNDLHFSIKLNILKTKKQITLNEKKVASNEIRKIFSVVVFSPESLSSIKESSEQRRNLIDDLLKSFDRNNSDLLFDYKKALKTRNKILKNFVQGVTPKNTTLMLLESLQPSFLRLATELAWKRITSLKELYRDFNEAMKYISKEDARDLSIEYIVSSKNILSNSKESINDAMRIRLEELRDAELAIGSSLVGPHKHDINFLYDQKDSRFFCSQGQQRAIILSFKMAQIVYHRKAYGVYPVLMLDDVLSELDKAKRDALITFLHEIKTQIFVTTTDFNLSESFNLDQIAVMNVRDGKISL